MSARPVTKLTLKNLIKENERLKSALRVIRTWAACGDMDMDTLMPTSIIKLCDETLEQEQE